MKNTILLTIVSGFLLAGCSSAFKASQTPDDVYYSYGNDKTVTDTRYKQNAEDEYVSYWGSAEENYLRMKVRDRDRWDNLDDLNYWYGYDRRFGWNNPYLYNNWGYNNMRMGWGWNSWNMPMFSSFYWNNPFGWGYNSFYNGWNNPFGWNRPIIVINKFPTNSSLNVVSSKSRADLNRYYNSQYQRGNASSVFDQKGLRSDSRLYRTVDRNNGMDNNSWSRPSRTFEGSSSNSSGSTRTSGSSSSSSSNSSGRTNSRGGN